MVYVVTQFIIFCYTFCSKSFNNFLDKYVGFMFHNRAETHLGIHKVSIMFLDSRERNISRNLLNIATIRFYKNKFCVSRIATFGLTRQTDRQSETPRIVFITYPPKKPTI